MQKRKAFTHFIEVSFAILIFTISILTSLSAIDIKTSFSSHRLVTTGISLAEVLRNTYKLEKIFSSPEEFQTEIEYYVPKNMYYGIEITGAPKFVIKVGCANCSGRAYLFLKSLLTPVYYNNRWVNFTVEIFDFTSISDAREFDSIIFVNFSNFDNNPLIQEYLSKGGRLIAINDINSTIFSNMDETFALSLSAGASTYLNFSSYPQNPKIAKYFIASGFDVAATNAINGKKNGKWKIWGNAKDVNITSSLQVEIEGVGALKEGDVFCLNGNSENPSLPNENFCFKIRKVFPELLFIQPLNSSFPFLDFSDSVKVRGSEKEGNILSSHSQSYSLVIINKTSSRAVWISYFPQSSEYRALLKGVIMAMNTEFIMKTFLGSEGIEIPIFYETCCDIPETVKILLKLGYKY